jgi:hypothetical protein
MMPNSISFRKQQIAEHVRVVATRNPHYVFCPPPTEHARRECSAAYYLSLDAQQRYQKSAENASIAASLAQINASRGSPDAHACSAAAATAAALCSRTTCSMLNRLVRALGDESTVSADLTALKWFDNQLEKVHGPYTQSFQPKSCTFSLGDLDFSRPCEGLSTDVVQELAELNRRLAEHVHFLAKADKDRQLVDDGRRLVDDQRKRLDEERRLADAARTTVDDARLTTDLRRVEKDIDRGKMDLAQDVTRRVLDEIRADMDAERVVNDVKRVSADTDRVVDHDSRVKIDQQHRTIHLDQDVTRAEADKQRAEADAARHELDRNRLLDTVKLLVEAELGNRSLMQKLVEVLHEKESEVSPVTCIGKLSPRTTESIRAHASEAVAACGKAAQSIEERDDYETTGDALVKMQLEASKTFLEEVRDDL